VGIPGGCSSSEGLGTWRRAAAAAAARAAVAHPVGRERGGETGRERTRV
jgi:hypothetical protein